MDRRHGLVAMMLLLVGCGDAVYKVNLGPDEAMNDAAGVDLVLLRVTCADLIAAGGTITEGWWVVTRTQWQGGQPSADLGKVPPAHYALVARVRSADCTVTWTQCVDIELERGKGGTIDVPLQQLPAPQGCLPGEICNGQGLCVPPPPCDNETVACDADGDHSLACIGDQTPPACDCNDADGTSYPGAPEICDGADNDCNGTEDDSPECEECERICPEHGVCERGDCTSGECVIVNRDDGDACQGESGPAVCCDGVCNGACRPGAVGTQHCGNCGTQERTCSDSCEWGAFGSCEVPADACTPDATRLNQPCGNCGTGPERCSAECVWEPDGVCTGEGVCEAGTDADAVDCGQCGQRIDTCADDCTWDTGACVGDPARDADCTAPDVCCPDGSCGDRNADCCGTDVSTCGPPADCTQWQCNAGNCTSVPAEAGTDPNDDCAGTECCDGAGACEPGSC